MDNEIIIAQWLMDNAAILLSEYSTISEEMSEYLYLKAVAHEQFSQALGIESFEEAFDSEKVQLLIDFYFRRQGDSDEIQ